MIRVLALVALASASAWADPESDADRAFRTAEQHAAAGDAHAIDELETLGAVRPVTRWTDDAWSEAARLAERASDYARARRDLEQALAVTTDEGRMRRLRGDLARVEAAAGAGGQWNEVAARHDKLEAALGQGGDPKPGLAQLESLVKDHPDYPRAAAAMVAIAHGWERDGDFDRARQWLVRARDAATSRERVYAQAQLVRFSIRHRDIAAASTELAAIEDPAIASELRALLAHAETRQMFDWLAWGALAGVLVAAVLGLWRAAGSWRAAFRRLARPPVEVYYLVPIAAVLVIVAATGNPLVSRAVRVIAIAGAVVTWISGSILDAVRARGRVRFVRAAIHALLAVIAVSAATYLAVDRDRMIDLVIETWRSGPQAR